MLQSYHYSSRQQDYPGQNGHAPLVIPLMLIVQLEPPCMPFPQVNYECLSSAQQHQENLADCHLVPKPREITRQTNQFFGWNAPETMGASNLIVRFRWHGSTSAAVSTSQTIAFQSFDVVKRYLEFRDQLGAQLLFQSPHEHLTTRVLTPCW